MSKKTRGRGKKDIKEQAPQHIYLDTSHLLPFLLLGESNSEMLLKGEKSSEMHFKNFFEDKLRLCQKNSNFHIKIPFVVIGETISKIIWRMDEGINEHRKDLEVDKIGIHVLSQLFKLINYQNVRMMPPSDEFFQYGKDIWVCESKRNDLKNTDISIISHALTDKNSTLLLTADRKINDSKERGCLNQYDNKFNEENIRNHNLKIEDRS